jgi:hypothetical protein
MSNIFDRELKVINIGLKAFGRTLELYNVQYVQLDWRPPIMVNDEALRIIQANRALIEEANAKAVERIVAGKPFLVGLSRAMEVIPGMRENLILHAGPPISWDRMCGPMRGAVIGALIYEKKAKNALEAEQLASSGKIEYSPCHHHGAVGPMAGIISASMPVWTIKNDVYGNTAFATMNEGLGKVLRYGAYSEEVIGRLRWMDEVLYPSLQKAIDRSGKIDLRFIISQALQMGDELHNRNRAATSLLFRTLAPAIVRTAADGKVAAEVLEFIHGNDHFFLNISMAAAKACLDSARGIGNSSIVVAMARNGVEFGIQLAGTGNDWFTGPAPIPDALYFAGFSKSDANPDIGDSAITETYGLGGFAIAASPAIVGFVGGNSRDAVNYTLEMYEITDSENGFYQIPYLDFRGVPTGINVIKIVEKNILPFIDTGVAHKDAGTGQIGAGVLNAPPEPFRKAFEGLAGTIKGKEESAK